MEDKLYVSCHAPCFSLLLYETARSQHDQKGLLIGQICNEVSTKKTDDNEANQEHKTAIYLEHCIPITDRDFFGNVGDVNKNKLQHFIECYPNKIMGWYSFRRNTSVNYTTMKEALIHKTLLSMIPNVNPEHFIIGFMSSAASYNFSTHSYNHIFMHYDSKKDRFEALKLKINSLSDKSLNSNGYSLISALPTSRQFNRIIQECEKKEESPVISVLGVCKKVEDMLKLFNKKLQETEQDRIRLEDEIEELKRKLGLNNRTDFVIDEAEDEKPRLKLHLLRYDPKTTYNPNRKNNPIQVYEDESNVPESDEDVEPEPEPEPEKPVQRSYSQTVAASSPKLPANSPKISSDSPKFTVKAPKMRPGISPQPNIKNNTPDKSPDSEDIIESDDDNSTSKKKEITNNSVERQNSMEY